MAKKGLVVPKVIQKAVVKVNEEGSEALKSISIFFRIQLNNYRFVFERRLKKIKISSTKL
jgi:hypothetical protein